MAASNPLLELCGEEIYREFFGEGGGTTPTYIADWEGVADLERFLLEASDNYEQQCEGQKEERENSVTKNVQRFAIPKSEEDVIAAQKARIPKKTQTDTNYCLRIWDDW